MFAGNHELLTSVLAVECEAAIDIPTAVDLNFEQLAWIAQAGGSGPSDVGRLAAGGH
jgi:hypothetical protein